MINNVEFVMNFKCYDINIIGIKCLIYHIFLQIKKLALNFFFMQWPLSCIPIEMFFFLYYCSYDMEKKWIEEQQQQQQQEKQMQQWLDQEAVQTVISCKATFSTACWKLQLLWLLQTYKLDQF